MKLTIREALNEAAELCSLSRQQGGGYRLVAPYRYADPRGAYTVHTYAWREKAVEERTKARARVALALMGRLDFNAAQAVDATRGSVRDRVRRALREPQA